MEDEVEKYIKRLFKTSSSMNTSLNSYDKLGVEDFAELLGKLKDSPEKKEKVLLNN